MILVDPRREYNEITNRRMRYSGVLSYAVLTLNLHFTGKAEGNSSCRDSQGRSFEQGFHYSPGPDDCTLCVCSNGNPKSCKAVLCAQPQDCKSFRVGNTCCEFICMDETLSAGGGGGGVNGGDLGDGNATSDMGLRLVASCVTAILFLSLIFFLIHRLRQRKIRVCVAGRQSRQLTDEQRSLGSMGYLERGGLSHGGPTDEMLCGGGYPSWKPAGNYFPRGEAPPPYEEAVAAARAEQALLSNNSPHAISQFNFPAGYLPPNNNNSNSNSNNNGGNLLVHQSSSMANFSNNQIGISLTTPNLSNGQLISNSVINRSLIGGQNSNQYVQQNDTVTNCGSGNNGNGYVTNSINGFTIGQNTYENLPPPVGITSNPVNQQPQHQTSSNNHHNHNQNNLIIPIQSSHSTIPKSYHNHTTLPRQGTGAFTISATLPSSGTSSHRTIPRTLATSGSLRLRRELTTHQSVAPLFDTKQLKKNNLSSPINTPPQSAPPITNFNNDNKNIVLQTSDSFYDELLLGLPPSSQSNIDVEQQQQKREVVTSEASNCDFKPKVVSAVAAVAANNETINQEGSIESVACACSMQALPTLHDDADDYRSECENCKSANGSRYYLDNQDELVTSPHETMTLHRRPEETPLGTTPQYYRTSLTLPTNTRQRTRSTGARENWFSSMPESSTESSDED